MNSKRITNSTLCKMIEEMAEKVEQVRTSVVRIDDQLRGDDSRPGHHERIRIIEDWKESFDAVRKDTQRLAKAALLTSIGAVATATVVGIAALVVRLVSAS